MRILYFPRPALVLSVLLSGLLLTIAPSVQAGCGCEKPPPALAAVRPAATYAGKPVTLFSSAFVVGQSYTITFTALSGQTASVPAQAVSRRDLGDGKYKSQISVLLPSILPLGPTGISVTRSGQSGPLVSITDAAFTVAPRPVAIPAQVGEFRYQNFRMAVDRNGVAHLSLDLSQVTLPMVFETQAKGYPLRFSSDDVSFYNIQGFLMQLLDHTMPGLGSIAATSGADSDILHYARHEFHTFYLQHDEKQTHATDPQDANWHLDGTRHIDHDYLVLAIAGTRGASARPAPGATPAFELVLKTHSLFLHGLVGVSSITMSNHAKIKSYNSKTELPGARGDIRSNGPVKLDNGAVVEGNATAPTFTLMNGAKITGNKVKTTQPLRLMPIAVPKELPDLGDIVLTNGATRTLVGPASYRVGKIEVDNTSRLLIDNTAGPVTLYVNHLVKVANGSSIMTSDTNPEKFALYVVNGGDVKLSNKGAFYGVVYAPQSVVDLADGQFFGAFVGSQIKVDNGAQIHYDSALRGE